MNQTANTDQCELACDTPMLTRTWRETTQSRKGKEVITHEVFLSKFDDRFQTIEVL